MKLQKVTARAKQLGIKNATRTPIRDLIRTIQVREGNTACFDTGKNDCGQMDCCWRDECLRSQGKLEILILDPVRPK